MACNTTPSSPSFGINLMSNRFSVRAAAKRDIMAFFRSAKRKQLPPSTRELADYCGCSHVTVQKAVEELIEERKLFNPRPRFSHRNLMKV